MSDALTEATRAEMKRQGCDVRAYGTDEEPRWECLEHVVTSRTEDQCSVVGLAVRTGWNAAINAALAVIEPWEWHAISSGYDQGYRNGTDDTTKLHRREVNALLTDAGDQG